MALNIYSYPLHLMQSPTLCPGMFSTLKMRLPSSQKESTPAYMNDSNRDDGLGFATVLPHRTISGKLPTASQRHPTSCYIPDKIASAGVHCLLWFPEWFAIYLQLRLATSCCTRNSQAVYYEFDTDCICSGKTLVLTNSILSRTPSLCSTSCRANRYSEVILALIQIGHTKRTRQHLMTMYLTHKHLSQVQFPCRTGIFVQGAAVRALHAWRKGVQPPLAAAGDLGQVTPPSPPPTHTVWG